MSTGAAVAAAARRAERLLVEHLRDAGAVDPSAATAIPDQRWMAQRVLSRLVRAGAIRQVGTGYYLDEKAYAAFDADRSRRMGVVRLVLVPLVVAAALVTWWASMR